MIHKTALTQFRAALHREKERRKKVEDFYAWERHARDNQLPPPGTWHAWLILAGRGFGKTRTGAETVRMWVHDKGYRHLALIGETELETRHVMVEGSSGLLSVHPPRERPLYESSKRQILWPNGAVATCFSATAYEQLRGPQFDGAWIDELAKFRESDKVWDQLMFGLRLGAAPRVIITTTPRPTPFLKQLLKDPNVAVTRGSTFDNAQNLAPPFLTHMERQYGDTCLGRQELYAEIVEETKGSLWNRVLIERAKADFKKGALQRIVIAVDPAVTNGPKSDETGIIVAGLTQEGIGVILEDLSGRFATHSWVQSVVANYHHWKADRVVAEVNMGGDLVEQLLRVHDPSLSYKGVRATRGKVVRAEPIAALYEQGKVWHASTFPHLEEQLCSYVPGQSYGSPDRLDALVWALTDLMLTPSFSGQIWGS